MLLTMEKYHLCSKSDYKIKSLFLYSSLLWVKKYF